MLLNDKQITELCIEKAMISPFVAFKTVKTINKGVLEPLRLPSYGLSSAGYDIRLSGLDFQVLDNAEDRHFKVQPDADGALIIPARSVALGTSVEHFNIPSDVMVIALMKSTYARQHVTHHITPLEPGWRGYLTFEIANLTSHPRKVYSNAGIAQLLFHKLESPCQRDYTQTGGKYQDQPQAVVHAK